MIEEIIEQPIEEPVDEALLVRGIKAYFSLPDEIASIKARLDILETK